MEKKQSERETKKRSRLRRDAGIGERKLTEPGTGDKPYEQSERGVGPEKDAYSPSPGPDQG